MPKADTQSRRGYSEMHWEDAAQVLPETLSDNQPVHSRGSLVPGLEWPLAMA